MNTPNTMALGWGSLLLAGGVAYYFAKKDINDRRDREHRKRMANTSGVAMNRHVVPHPHPGDESKQSITSEAATPPSTKSYRLAQGNSTEGRDRGDRL